MSRLSFHPSFSLAACLLALLAPPFPIEAISNPGSGDGDGNWLVRIDEAADPRKVAESLGAAYLGPLENVAGYHRIRFYQTLKGREDGVDVSEPIRTQLEAQPQVTAFEEDEWLVRFPRSFEPDDPRFPEQWHLENVGQSGGLPFADIRVRPVWDDGFSGDGVTVAIVDEGTQFRHPDLLPNWLEGSGYDYNGDDNDPSPSGSDDRHGTAVAGITLASANTDGGLGVAYRAKLVPLRLIAGAFRTGEEAEALSYRKQEVDIYNNSWGPSDDFGVRYVDTSSVLKTALGDNVLTGRGGRGNIYVWAAGNGGLNGDNSNYDGYNASPYTISVGAVGHDDIRAGYSEPGANLLVVAPSGGRGAGILTTDNTGSSGYAPGNVYENFSGTSAATPIVSGVVALLLEKRPDLGWRDVQQILALSASPVDFSEDKWSRNGAGYWVSHDYGFGRVDAEAALKLADGWQLLGPMEMRTGRSSGGPVSLPQNQTVSRIIPMGGSILVQHVQVGVTINHSDWGDLRIELISPSGTRSVLAEPHANANSSGQPGSWTYLSTHHLGELSQGNWILEVTDERTGDSGTLVSWTLQLWGTALDDNPNEAPTADDLFIESVAFPVTVEALNGITDPDGDPIELLSIQRPRTGTVEAIGPGQFRFTMGESKDGTDQFSVLVSDGRGGIYRRFIHILDPRPVGRNDLYPVLSGEPTILPVLRNDLDPDGDLLRLTRVGGAFSGTVTVREDGTLEYLSPPGFTGVDRIQYELTDDSDGSSSGWVTVIVQESGEVALDFDGEDDYMVLNSAPSIQTTDRFTLEAWIYPEDWGEYVTGFGRIYDRDTLVFFLNGFDHSFYNDRSLVAYFILDNGQAVAANSVGGRPSAEYLAACRPQL
jgi:subtilisin-like proprotein convertase family protein/subtilisin family serine protease